MHVMPHHTAKATGRFSRDTDGLPTARARGTVRLADGDELSLRIAAVAKRIGDATVRMLAYNGSIPGPTIRVEQGSEVLVHVTNDGDVDATVHWHGIRLDNRYDGVPYETQDPIPVGGSFTYRVRFPDEGVYWYHPHVREDYTLDMGLYGNIVVEPADPRSWPPADREEVLAIDDLLIEDGKIAPYDRSGPDHVAMGRFGNVLLVNGEPEWSLAVRRGEVVRFFFTNTANTRMFNLGFAGATMKIVGGDSGRYEHDVLVDDVMVAPSERAVVDVLFDGDAVASLQHRTPGRIYPLGTVDVTDEPGGSSARESFHELRWSQELLAERARLAVDLDREPDEVLALVAEMTMAAPIEPDEGADPSSPRFACPMHPEIVRNEPGRCPICGMNLVPIELVPEALERVADGSSAHEHGDEPGETETGDRLEWEDTMQEVNRRSTADNTHWMLVDRRTGNVNHAIDWRFEVGDRVKIRLVNEMDSDHPMPHPIHIHGAGRFLVLARDGIPEENLVWKDTVLVRTGEVVDIVLDVSNPGRWMVHCHIAEHVTTGMMFSFQVDPRPQVPQPQP
ncbi:MAG TPA: multicopper oxidase family protein [Actinomycetota bacterium]